MKKIFGNINEKGTLLVEAMAMLGLIAMVTPVLYKKAAERTVELQDVNASSQLRALSSAVDSYLKDNFAKITKGDTIDGIDYGSFANADSGTVGPIPLNHFADYLPYGFLTDGGAARETKLFTDDYQVWVKLEADYANYTDPDGNPQRKALSQILTGFVSATPKNAEELGQVRSSRIASMIGSNGGYVLDDSTVMGAQGIWSVPVDQFNGLNAANRPFVVSSLQPISSQGLANEDVLHRKDEPDADQELNTMETDLFMGFSENTTRNIRMVNQIIMNPDPERMVKVSADPNSKASPHNASDNMQPLAGNDAQDLDRALYIAKGGGAYIEGALNAMNSLFSVNGQGIRYFGQNETDELQPDGSTKKITSRAAEPVMKIDSTSLVYGNPGAGNAKLTVNSAGSMSFASTEVKADDGTVTEAAGESLYADKTNFRAGDGNFRVSKENVAGGDAKWVSVFNTGDAHEGGRTTYTWNGAVPTEDAAEATGKYEVSINGSAFVKDTLLTGKIKSYNVDTAKLRAGVSTNDFDGAIYDEEYYMVVDEDIAGIGFQGMGTTKRPKLLVSDRDGTWGPNTLDTINVYQGIQMQTPNSEGGIDIAAGNTALPDIDDYVDDDTESTQENMVRIGAQKGISLSTYDAAGNDQNSTDANPVRISLNGDTFAVSKRKPYNNNQGNTFYNTIDSVVDSFNIYSTQINTSQERKNADNYWRNAWSRTLHGRMFVGDTAFIVGTKEGNPIFEAFPAYSPFNGWKTYPEYNAAIKVTGGLAVYDYDYNHLVGSDNANTTYGHGRDAAIYANKGRFEIRATDYSDPTKNLVKNGNELDKILVVDSNKNTTYVPDKDTAHGSVYIRKGSVNLATYGSGEIGGNKNRLTNANILDQYTGDAAAKEKGAVGYVAADRFISQFKVDNNKVLSATVSGSANVQGAGFTPYEYYEVNPAYTSVMHDIKLTTRGGARLSDILPDFINKGIYVVDTTYSPNATWVPGTSVIPTAEVGDSAENEVSAFAGFIPTPKCPPGYAKVVTLTPSGWAMAQAGTPVQNGGTIDIMSHNNPKEFIDLDPTTGDTVQPLTFQKNTWLKAMVLPYCGTFQEDGTGCGENFRGWGAIMGFIYPHSYYTEFINQAGLGGKQNDNDVYWNLFPVYYKQLEGYATVYCYFDRKDANLDSNYVDKAYDQLSDYKSSPSDAKNVFYYEKNHGVGTSNAQYINRLNDPNLKYKDPW